MSKKKSHTFKQKGGNSDLVDLHLWGQDQSPPSSYKIQLGYIEIPKTIQFDEKWVDTPYRFRSFHDANIEADRIFGGYLFRIVGSNEHPYWDAPSYLHQNRNTLDVKQDNRWYDVVGIEPLEKPSSYKYSTIGQTPILSPERQYALSQLSKLHTPIESQKQITNEQPVRKSSIEHPSQFRKSSETQTRRSQIPSETQTRRSQIPLETQTRRSQIPSETQTRGSQIPLETQTRRSQISSIEHPSQFRISEETQTRRSQIPKETQTRRSRISEETQTRRSQISSDSMPSRSQISSETQIRRFQTPTKTHSKS